MRPKHKMWVIMLISFAEWFSVPHTFSVEGRKYNPGVLSQRLITGAWLLKLLRLMGDCRLTRRENGNLFQYSFGRL